MFLYLNYFSQILSVGEIHIVTGIPTSTLYKYISGAYSPSPARETQLRNTYRSFQYSQLRQAGLSVSEARRFRDFTPDTVDTVISNIRDAISRVAEEKGLIDATVREGMKMSRKHYEDLIQT